MVNLFKNIFFTSFFQRAKYENILPFFIILLLQSAYLFLFQPLYEPDLHYFTRGALHWDVQHPPLYNIYLSICHKIWPSIYLPVFIQLFLYALSCQFIIRFLFKNNLYSIALSFILGVEPNIAFYNISLLSESLFISFSLLLFYFCFNKKYLTAGIFLGIALSTRYTALFYLPALFAIFFIEDRFQIKLKKHFAILAPLFFFIVFITIGQKAINNAGFVNNRGQLRWMNAAPFYQAKYCEDSVLKKIIDREFFESKINLLNYDERYIANIKIIHQYAHYLQKKHNSNDVFLKIDAELGKIAHSIENEYRIEIHLLYLKSFFNSLWNKNYLDYRTYLSGLSIENEYEYLDQMVYQLYKFKRNENHIFFYWKSPVLINYYIRTIIVLSILCFMYLFFIKYKYSLYLALIYFTPILLLVLSEIPFKTRFIVVYFPFGYLLFLLSIKNKRTL